ncbi:MAG TPA: DNA-directed RNA polymerase subunit D [Candidatus Pacearchaeota archaeon]|nr:DNA-directed RNA polymerase subunit D [archaeon BMS3Abin17]HDK42761.1 DNA-directed RNA polymerase subunit D [Candidatus Pacearchaeota archaeon]HDZ60126.1 DNA-directed RNA polymerase subunit D [Candidatus Pacearchaeota archaeon]
MKIINKKDNQITFQADIEEGLANSIRRYMNQIQVIAIDEVEISRNDSPLYDETIAHRMGLIPLKMDKTLDEKKSEKLKIKSKEEGMVYSGEFKGKVKVAYGKIPITSLSKGQELEATATTGFGTGSEHSKFSPGLMFYRNVFDIKVDKDCPKKIAETCPKEILKLENGKVIVKDAYKCDFCEACVEKCRKIKKDYVKITPVNSLIITLESFGQLETGEILKKSIDALKKDLAEVSKKISK